MHLGITLMEDQKKHQGFLVNAGDSHISPVGKEKT